MSSYITTEISITRQSKVLNDLSIDVAPIFDLDVFTDYKFLVIDKSDNVILTKLKADITRTNQNLYIQFPADELTPLIGVHRYTLMVISDEGPQMPAKGSFIILK